MESPLSTLGERNCIQAIILSRLLKSGCYRLFDRWYDPLKKETNLNAPALKKWLANGAQPSDTVKALLQKAFVIEPTPVKVVVPKDAVKMP